MKEILIRLLLMLLAYTVGGSQVGQDGVSLAWRKKAARLPKVGK